MHTKERILKALLELHKEEPNIDPYGFTTQQVSKRIGRTIATTEKWCHVLANEGKIIRTWSEILSHYFGVRLVEVN